MEVNIVQLVDVELPLRVFEEHHVAELKQLFLTQNKDYSLGSIYATTILAHGNKLSEMTCPGNIQTFGDILGVNYRRHRISAIILFRGEFPDIVGHHGWVHRPMNIYVFVCSDDGFPTGR